MRIKNILTKEVGPPELQASIALLLVLFGLIINHISSSYLFVTICFCVLAFIYWAEAMVKIDKREREVMFNKQVKIKGLPD